MNKTILGFLIISFLVCSVACKNSSTSKGDRKSKFHDIVHNPTTAEEDSQSEDIPILNAPITEFIFGKIKQGEVVSHEFKISNTGRRNLIILDSQSSCGCTVSEYPEDPLPPQATSYVKVTFDSKGKSGVQEKKVIIYSNTTPNETIFVLKGEVTN